MPPSPSPEITKDDEVVTLFQPAMLSRLLYPNPVVFLSVKPTSAPANLMTLTWLTPIDNQVWKNLLTSIQPYRMHQHIHAGLGFDVTGTLYVLNQREQIHSRTFEIYRIIWYVITSCSWLIVIWFAVWLQLSFFGPSLLPSPFVIAIPTVLSIPTSGMEKTIVSVGKCSGRDIKDKFSHVGLSRVKPGWDPGYEWLQTVCPSLYMCRHCIQISIVDISHLTMLSIYSLMRQMSLCMSMGQHISNGKRRNV